MLGFWAGLSLLWLVEGGCWLALPMEACFTCLNSIKSYLNLSYSKINVVLKILHNFQQIHLLDIIFSYDKGIDSVQRSFGFETRTLDARASRGHVPLWCLPASWRVRKELYVCRFDIFIVLHGEKARWSCLYFSLRVCGQWFTDFENNHDRPRFCQMPFPNGNGTRSSYPVAAFILLLPGIWRFGARQATGSVKAYLYLLF